MVFECEIRAGGHLRAKSGSKVVSVERQGKLEVWLEAECPAALVHAYQQAHRDMEEGLSLSTERSAVTSCCSRWRYTSLLGNPFILIFG